MPSYSSWNGEKSSGSKRLLTDILKGELGFEGFLISDYNALDQLPGDYRSDIKQSINAGMDMVMVPERYREFYTTLKGLVEAGEVPMSRIDDAVLRILRVKFAMGLFDEGRSPLADRRLHARFGSRRAPRGGAARGAPVAGAAEERQADAAALEDREADPRGGRNADDIGRQAGGWTIDWQGKAGPVTTGGTTILAALQRGGRPGRR